MTTKDGTEVIHKALAAYQVRLTEATSTLEKHLKAALNSGDVVGGVASFNRILDEYTKQHQLDLGTVAMLSGVSKNTMTRLKKTVESSRLETIGAVLDVMGLELVIARKGTKSE
ncbi:MULTISPECIES: hypothetical protein [unclassified Alteromonas]|uniref:hypothetical protein n=1 Tax=unclassified Alteromonas TaxID=2614992 RepID=UPI000509E51E|nr:MULTISPECIES: hypothetical protein [unclassified Alteromonas]